MMAGENRPRMSKTLAVPEAITRLVIDLGMEMLIGVAMWSVSLATSQWTPRALGVLSGDEMMRGLDSWSSLGIR